MSFKMSIYARSGRLGRLGRVAVGVGVVLLEVEVAFVVEHAVEHERCVAVGAFDRTAVERGVAGAAAPSRTPSSTSAEAAWMDRATLDPSRRTWRATDCPASSDCDPTSFRAIRRDRFPVSPPSGRRVGLPAVGLAVNDVGRSRRSPATLETQIPLSKSVPPRGWYGSRLATRPRHPWGRSAGAVRISLQQK